VSDSPRVSVIVPVRDRAGFLAATLGSFAQQTYADFEVIVVDDGSADDSGDVARAARAGRGPVRVVRTEGVGAVRARCAAVAEACGDILAFTDSDCVADPSWLAEGVRAIDKGADVAQGITVPVSAVGALERSISHSGTERLFATCNVFYRRDSYEAAGGFDGAASGRLGFRAGTGGRALGFGEDTLLGWRVARAGTAVVVPEAVVRHEVVSPAVRELVWRAWMAGGFPALVREVPELRATLLRQGIFLGYRRVPIYAGLLALALGRREIAALALLWWAGSRARRSRRQSGPIGRRLLAVPVEMGIDVVMAVGLLWGSARSRSVVV
jgi:GT2 family glycosyltransferase